MVNPFLTTDEVSITRVSVGKACNTSEGEK